jgi:nitroreductase
MTVTDLVSDRRSIRRFTDRDIPDEILFPVLESVRWAPSWGNSQCWEVVVVREVMIKEQLAETLSERNPATLAVKNAPVVLAICAALSKAGYYKGTPMTGFGDWFLFDLGLATQNLVLTAHALGLGSVIVGGMDQEKAKATLQVPEGFELAVLIPLGFPDQHPSAPERRELNDYVHNDLFTSKS